MLKSHWERMGGEGRHHHASDSAAAAIPTPLNPSRTARDGGGGGGGGEGEGGGGGGSSVAGSSATDRVMQSQGFPSQPSSPRQSQASLQGSPGRQVPSHPGSFASFSSSSNDGLGESNSGTARSDVSLLSTLLPYCGKFVGTSSCVT